MWDVQRREVLEAAQRMAARGLVTGTSGNVSVRVTDEAGGWFIAITPSGCHYDSMTLNDIVLVDAGGKKIEGDLAPSIETMLHLAVYRARRKVSAVVHTHAVFSSVVAVSHTEIPAILDDQIAHIGGEIRVASYALPGSQELAANVVDALSTRNAVIMANHGALTVGRDMKEALGICELLEKTSQVFIYALSLNSVNKIPPQMADLEKTFFSAIYGDDS